MTQTWRGNVVNWLIMIMLFRSVQSKYVTGYRLTAEFNSGYTTMPGLYYMIFSYKIILFYGLVKKKKN